MWTSKHMVSVDQVEATITMWDTEAQAQRIRHTHDGGIHKLSIWKIFLQLYFLVNMPTLLLSTSAEIPYMICVNHKSNIPIHAQLFWCISTNLVNNSCVDTIFVNSSFGKSTAITVTKLLLYNSVIIKASNDAENFTANYSKRTNELQWSVTRTCTITNTSTEHKHDEDNFGKHTRGSRTPCRLSI